MLVRDSLYTTAWFGLMSVVWFGWAQESPPDRLRTPLIVGSVIGLVVTIAFGVLTALNWSEPTALEGRYTMFGIVVGAEFALAGAGAVALQLSGHQRWVAWWVALIVAVHLVSLAWIFHGQSVAFLGIAQTVALIAVALAARGDTYPTSRWAGPVMGVLFLVYALGNGAFLVRELASS
ncbi:MAG: hypothetical protein L0H96_03125 [Humibacillus sp.]|nr:hypothetical protein [Humibacillus sp.]MDN5775884.1 hypothetical protein [Humibacillus sp.]